MCACESIGGIHVHACLFLCNIVIQSGCIKEAANLVPLMT